MPTRAALTILSIILFGAVVNAVYLNRGIFSQRQDSSGERFVDRIVRETPSNSIIEAPWVFVTPLAYAAYVEHRLGQRIIIDGSTHQKEVEDRLSIWAKIRPVFVIHFETDPRFVPCARLLPVDIAAPPLVYRVIPDPKGMPVRQSSFGGLQASHATPLSQIYSTEGIYPDGWTAAGATFQVSVPPTAQTIMLHVVVAPFAYKPGKEGISLRLDDQPRESRHNLPTGRQTVSFPVSPSIRGKTISAEITVDATFVPSKLGINGDNRQLGVVFSGTSFLVTQKAHLATGSIAMPLRTKCVKLLGSASLRRSF